MKRIIQGNIGGKKVLGLFILTTLVYALMLSVTIPKVMSFAGDMKILDMLPGGYDTEYVMNLFQALGKEGRSVYLTNQIPVDMIYPGLFAITYCLLLGYFLNKLNRLDSRLFYLCLIPVVAGLADYMENFGIIAMLNNYPDISGGMVAFANASSIIKSSATTIYFIILIIILVIFGIKKLKK